MKTDGFYHIILASSFKCAMNVTQRIVPAMASTIAIVAALLVQEVFRFKTFCCCSASDRNEQGELENYVMYSGDAQAYMHTFALERNRVGSWVPRYHLKRGNCSNLVTIPCPVTFLLLLTFRIPYAGLQRAYDTQRSVRF